MCRFGLATILTTVVVSLEELVVERCYDLITTAAFRAMGGCKKLKVSCGTPWCSLQTQLVYESRLSVHQMFCSQLRAGQALDRCGACVRNAVGQWHTTHVLLSLGFTVQS